MEKWQCMECGKTFRSVRAAERAAHHGCPNCGGVDIDIHTGADRVHRNPNPEPPRCACGVTLEGSEIETGTCDYCV